MKLDEMLKAQGLSSEQITSLLAALKENKIYLSSEENIDERYRKLKLQKEDVEQKLQAAEETISALKTANKDNEALQATILEHETTISTLKSEYETKIREISINAAIQAKLKDTKYPELLATKIDNSKLTISENGDVFGIDEQLANIREQYKDLFTPPVSGQEAFKAGRTTPGGINPWSKEHYNLTEQGRLLRENPDLAKQYMSARKES